MISANTKARGIAAWSARARQLHDEANRCASIDLDLPTSLMLRRAAFAAERNVREWENYEVSPTAECPPSASHDEGHHDPTQRHR
jgi:hypothetical protein